MGTTAAELIGEGYAALGAGRSEDSHRLFSESIAIEETAEALEGLGHAARWLVDPDGARNARERAYRLYRDSGRRAAAAGVAAWLGEDARLVHGDESVAAGWYSRARTLLEGLDDVPERGLLALQEGEHALFESADAVTAAAEGARAAKIGRAHGIADLEHVGHALHGLASVALGRVDQGMRELDAASTAAIAGEVTLGEAGRIWCYLIFACERVRDVQRAGEWCTTVRRRAEELQSRQLFGYCRTHYAGMLTARGEWAEAEKELAAAAEDFATAAPGAAVEADMALAELRRRQGRPKEAKAICDRYPSHHASLLCAAELAYDRGEVQRAGELLERRNRRLSPEVVDAELPGLDLAVRIHVALGDLEAARRAAGRLGALAHTEASKAAAAYAAGISAGPEARADARRSLEDAIDGWSTVGMPLDVARARVALARNLQASGRRDDAEVELEAARVILGAVGARFTPAHMDIALAAVSAAPDGELTAREQEILRHVADGLSDKLIAERLHLSPHTVHRHVANIRTKLRQPSRAAAAAWAAREGLI